MNPDSLLVSKKVAAQQLAISLRTLENLIAAQQLVVRRIGRRVVIPRKALEQFTRRDHQTKSRPPGQIS
ncbi:MAG TPA: helix-turn-helix domain-containing protein [Terriglobales bacterium]|nr:helix-turn-helix domain-containing protein [Terriglobales bacterium]